MKKTIAFILIAMLSVGLFTNSAYAKSNQIELSNYSLDELKSLYDSVRNELFNRLDIADDNYIGRGTYVVGRDIKDGTYVLTIKETDTYNEIRIEIAETEEEMSDVWNTPIGEHVVISLSDGQVLYISGCVCYITASNPIWTP